MVPPDLEDDPDPDLLVLDEEPLLDCEFDLLDLEDDPFDLVEEEPRVVVLDLLMVLDVEFLLVFDELLFPDVLWVALPLLLVVEEEFLVEELFLLVLAVPLL